MFKERQKNLSRKVPVNYLLVCIRPTPRNSHIHPEGIDIWGIDQNEGEEKKADNKIWIASQSLFMKILRSDRMGE